MLRCAVADQDRVRRLGVSLVRYVLAISHAGTRMIFESLHGSAKVGELLLIDGGYCRWHLRRDGTITIYEIISLRPGAGWEMLIRLIKYRKPIQAKCPQDLPANAWYARRGFDLIRIESTRSGRMLNTWRLECS